MKLLQFFESIRHAMGEVRGFEHTPEHDMDLFLSESQLISPQEAAALIAQDDELFDVVSGYTTWPDIFDDYPDELRKFLSVLSMVKPFQKRLYRGEREYGYNDWQPYDDHHRGFTSWAANEEVPRKWFNERGNAIKYTDGPVKAVSLSDIADARMRLHPEESHYGGMQAEYFVLEPVQRKVLGVHEQIGEAIDPRQLVNVDTPQFRSWFGNSKAVDDEGHPIVFFRGTAKNPRADQFGTKRSIPSFVASADIASIYAASYPKMAFGPAFGEEPPPPTFQPAAQVTPVFLSIQNPVDLRGREFINFEMDLFGLLNSDWSNYQDFEMALSVMRQLSRLEGKGVVFEYSLPDPPGGLESGDWGNVIEWLYDNWEVADDETWSGHAAEEFTSVLAEIEVDAYAIVDTPTFREWASAKGFDGVVHDDVFAQGAKYAQSLLGKDVPNGLDEDDMHITWRPFAATQVKSIFNQGGWSTQQGSPMTDSIGEARNPNVRVKYLPKRDEYRAYIGRKFAGYLSLYPYKDSKLADDERYAWKAAVEPEFQRQGVATALYDVVAKQLEKEGLKLVPSPENQLSDDAFKFWKDRDIESVRHTNRFKAQSMMHLVGKAIEVKGRPAIITRMLSDTMAMYRYTDVPEGSTNSQGSTELKNIRIAEAAYLHVHKDGRRVVDDKECESKKLREARKKNWTYKDITPKIIADIQRIAKLVHDDEGCDINNPDEVAHCWMVAEILENKYGWEKMSGVYLSRTGEPVGTHVWNVLRDGTIIDSTSLQWHEGHDFRIIPPDDPEHKRFRYEWFQDYNPDLADDYPELHGTEWSGEYDTDAINRLNKERGHKWWVNE